jgi:hypothetical protein
MVEGWTATFSFHPPCSLRRLRSGRQTPLSLPLTSLRASNCSSTSFGESRPSRPFSPDELSPPLLLLLPASLLLALVASKMQINTNLTSPSSTDEPTRKILAQQDMEGWQRSEALSRIDDFIQALRSATQKEGVKEEKEPSQVRSLFFSVPTAFESSLPTPLPLAGRQGRRSVPRACWRVSRRGQDQ